MRKNLLAFAVLSALAGVVGYTLSVSLGIATPAHACNQGDDKAC